MTDTSFFDEPFSTEVWLLPWEDHGITHVLRFPAMHVTVEVYKPVGYDPIHHWSVLAPRNPVHDIGFVVAAGWALTKEAAMCAGALSAHQLDFGVLCR